MGLDLNEIYAKMQRMPAVFVSELQYHPESGLISDYFNVVDCFLALYDLGTSDEMWRRRDERIEGRVGRDKDSMRETFEPSDYRTHFAGYLLATETYHDYLERKLTQFNDWLIKDPVAVKDSLENTLPSIFLRRGFSAVIRPVSYDEFMGVLYHEKAQRLNRVVREFKRSIFECLEKSVSFEEMDHRGIFGTLKAIADFHYSDHKLKDVDEWLIKYGLVKND